MASCCTSHIGDAGDSNLPVASLSHSHDMRCTFFGSLGFVFGGGACLEESTLVGLHHVRYHVLLVVGVRDRLHLSHFRVVRGHGRILADYKLRVPL